MTLYKVAVNARRFILGFLIFSIVVIAGDAIYKRFFLNELAPFTPTLSQWNTVPLNQFGEVEFPDVPTINIDTEITPQFVLRGEYPEIIPDVARIYQIEQPQEKLGATAAAENNAELMGFDPKEYTDNGGTLIWENNRRTRKLEYDIVNRNWNLTTTSYFQDPNALREKETGDDVDYDREIRSLANQLGLLRPNMESGLIEHQLVARTTNSFRELEFGEDPEFAAGSIYRNMTMILPLADADIIDPSTNIVISSYNVNVYGDDPDFGSLFMVVDDKAEDPALNLYELTFTDFQYTNNFSRYLLKSPDVAWQEIQTGNGYLTSLIPSNKDRFSEELNYPVSTFTADANQVELAYYEPDEWTGYIYPIYLFRGTAELADGELASFVFYANALRE